MDLTVLQFLAAPFAASLILTGIHAYLGVHVVERGYIVVDLLRADLPRSARLSRCCCRFPALMPRRRLLDQPPRSPCLALLFSTIRDYDSHSRNGHRDLLRDRLGGGHPRDVEASAQNTGRTHPAATSWPVMC